MRNLKTLLTSGLIIGVCLVSALPAVAATKTPDPNADLLAQIKTLTQTEKGLADQLTSLDIQTQRKIARAQKNFAALLAAKNDQISFEPDNTTARAYRLTLEKDNIQLQIDRQAKNATNITADMNIVITDLNNLIGARTQLIKDGQQILADLSVSAT